MHLGYPKFQYKVPDCPWHIIVTSKALHFYFNSETNQSYWQLSDFTDGEHLANKIDYDQVSILMAKARGLRIDSELEKVKSKPNSKLESKSKSFKCRENEAEDVENFNVDDQFINKVLRKEGYIENDVAEEVDETIGGDIDNLVNERDEKEKMWDSLNPQNESIKNDITQLKEQKNVELIPSNGLAVGYSSSEEEDDDIETVAVQNSPESEKDKKLVEDYDINEKEQIQVESECEVGKKENDFDGIDQTPNLNEGLDLDISDEDSGNDNETNINQKQEFWFLLNSLQDKISVYDPWFIVKEELIKELSLNESFYSLDEKIREEVYNEWAALKVKENDKNVSDDFAFASDVVGCFPSGKQIYLKFLQQHKNESKMFYIDFKRKLAKELEELFQNSEAGSLGSNTKESIFRQYNAMLKDFKEYEKINRKKNPNTNLKLQKLKEFLKENLEIDNSLKNSEKYERFTTGCKKFIESSTNKDDEELNHEMWYLMCNFFKISKSVCESPWNFIVGGKKRVQAYSEILGISG